MTGHTCAATTVRKAGCRRAICPVSSQSLWHTLCSPGAMATSTPHATTGTMRRPAHSLSGQGLQFSIANEARELRADLARSSGGRAAKTLAKAGGLRATLVLLESGRTLEPD